MEMIVLGAKIANNLENQKEKEKKVNTKRNNNKATLVYMSSPTMQKSAQNSGQCFKLPGWLARNLRHKTTTLEWKETGDINYNRYSSYLCQLTTVGLNARYDGRNFSFNSQTAYQYNQC